MIASNFGNGPAGIAGFGDKLRRIRHDASLLGKVARGREPPFPNMLEPTILTHMVVDESGTTRSWWSNLHLLEVWCENTGLARQAIGCFLLAWGGAGGTWLAKPKIRSGCKFGKTAPYTKAIRCLAKQIRKEIEGYGSPKRWMGAAVVSFIASASLSFGAYSMQNKYNNAKTIPELDKYKNSRNNYLTGAGACFLAAGASVIIYIDLNKKNRQRKSVVKN